MATLQELRLSRSLGMRALARKAGVSVNTITKIERGQGSIYAATLKRIASALDISPEEITGVVITKTGRWKGENAT